MRLHGYRFLTQREKPHGAWCHAPDEYIMHNETHEPHIRMQAVNTANAVKWRSNLNRTSLHDNQDSGLPML